MTNVLRSGWRWMRWINEPQDRPTHAELNAVAVVERRGRCNALFVEERSVETAQVNEQVLAVASLNLCVTARDDCRRRFNRHFHTRLTP